MACEFPQGVFIHKRACVTMLIHRSPLGGRSWRKRVMVGRTSSLERPAAVVRGSCSGFKWPRSVRTCLWSLDFGRSTEGGVMTTRWLTTAALVAVASIGLVGCNDGPTSPASSAPTHATATGASSSLTPTPTKSLTPAEQDLADAELAISNYWRVVDATASNPKADLNVLATVARGQALAQWQSTIAGYRSKRWVQQGDSTLRDLMATKVRKNQFKVTACRDVTTVDVVDGAGKSVVEDSRPDRQRFTYTVEKAPEGYFVTADLLKGEPCDA